MVQKMAVQLNINNYAAFSFFVFLIFNVVVVVSLTLMLYNVLPSDIVRMFSLNDAFM